MGSPLFACPSLEALAGSSHEVIRVVTQPDRPAGRGRALRPPPVKELAEKLGIQVIQPAKVKTEEFINRMQAINPDIFVVVAYGKILPQSLLDVPKHGSINVHASLLPKYRGAAPVTWAIINGDEITGITTMLMDAGMDTGDILLKREEDIQPDDTAGSLYERLAEVGAELAAETLEKLEAGKITPIKQDDSLAQKAPLLKKSDGCVEWNLPALKIHNHIRGMNPWPGAYTFMSEKTVKLHVSNVADGLEADESSKPGQVLEAGKRGIVVATGDGAIIITELQAAGGKRMTASEFLKGHKLEPGTFFSSEKSLEG